MACWAAPAPRTRQYFTTKSPARGDRQREATDNASRQREATDSASRQHEPTAPAATTSRRYGVYGLDRRQSSLDDHGSVCGRPRFCSVSGSPEQKFKQTGHWHRAPGCEPGVRVNLVSLARAGHRPAGILPRSVVFRVQAAASWESSRREPASRTSSTSAHARNAKVLSTYWATATAAALRAASQYRITGAKYRAGHCDDRRPAVPCVRAETASATAARYSPRSEPACRPARGNCHRDKDGSRGLSKPACVQAMDRPAITWLIRFGTILSGGPDCPVVGCPFARTGSTRFLVAPDPSSVSQ